MKKTTILLLIILMIVSSMYSQRRALVASLYPYIPDAENFYLKVEKRFEEQYPDINLIINLNALYYDNQKGIINEQADVYEIDCSLLDDFITKGKIQPLPSKFKYDKEKYLPMSEVVVRNSKYYAIPHWACGNFLFYNASDSLFLNYNSLVDLEKIIWRNPKPKKWIID